MSRILEADDPRAYQGLERQPAPVTKFPDMANLSVPCPACDGYGGRIYSVRDDGTNGTLIQCLQCNGWGWVRPGKDAECKHTFDAGRNVGRCLTQYTCKKCGAARVVDSSD